MVRAGGSLIGNGFKYNDQTVRRVEVGFIAATETAPDERWTLPPPPRSAPVFYVRDNGIGIDARHFHRVFEMFKRLHDQDGFGGGSGAGLTIARRLIERHGGRIWLCSRMGEGTTFLFTLAPDAEGLQ